MDVVAIKGNQGPTPNYLIIWLNIRIILQYTELNPKMFMRMGVEREVVVCKVKLKGKDLICQGGPIAEIINPVVSFLPNQTTIPYN